MRDGCLHNTVERDDRVCGDTHSCERVSQTRGGGLYLLTGVQIEANGSIGRLHAIIKAVEIRCCQGIRRNYARITDRDLIVLPYFCKWIAGAHSKVGYSIG